MPYLHDMIDDHKAPMKLKVHSGNKISDHQAQFGEWKIQLSVQVNFISSKDTGETCIMPYEVIMQNLWLGVKQVILLMIF